MYFSPANAGITRTAQNMSDRQNNFPLLGILKALLMQIELSAIKPAILQEMNAFHVVPIWIILKNMASIFI